MFGLQNAVVKPPPKYGTCLPAAYVPEACWKPTETTGAIAQTASRSIRFCVVVMALSGVAATSVDPM